MRHGLIGDHEVDVVLAPDDFERLLAGARLQHSVAEIFQHGRGIEQHQGVIIHREDDKRTVFANERLDIRQLLKTVGIGSRRPEAKARPWCLRPCCS